MNRWCIIAGARSGSTWFEEMIFNNFEIKNYQIKLGEPLEHSSDYFKSSGHNYTISLNEFGYLDLKRLTDKTFNDNTEYLDYLIETFKKGNRNQSIVLKIFPQEWKYSENEYVKFLDTLKELDFQFINLSRKITDRAISWYIMQERKIVHRWRQGDNNFYSTINGVDNDISDIPANSISMDIETFGDYMNLTLQEDTLKSKIISRYNCIDVNYETLISDCVKNNIPISQSTWVQKLYSTTYADAISNYKELLEITNEEDFIKKYGIHSSLDASTFIKNKKTDNTNGAIIETACQFAWDYPIFMLSRNEFRNCCRASTNKIPSEAMSEGKDLFKNFAPVKQLKRDLLTGVKNTACKSCWAIEQSNGKSPRTGLVNFSKFVQHNLWPKKSVTEVKEKLLNLNEQEIEEIINIQTTRMIEISLGNTCDLKCMYCHPHYSSQWASEQIKYKELQLVEVEKELPKEGETDFEKIWWDWFESGAGYTVKYINFIGGEPLIINKFYSYVDRIIEFYDTHETPQNYINISVVSNFNTPPKQFEMFLKTVERLVNHKKFKLDFNISMESIDSRAEFIRTGTDWNIMKSNIDRFLEFANEIDTGNPQKIIFNAQIALNALCITDLYNYFMFIIDLQRNNSRKINLRQNQISYPQWLSPYILPESYSVHIDNVIELIELEFVDNDKYTVFGRWDSYIKFLKGIKNGILNPNKNIEARKEFVKNIDKLTSRRNLNFAKTFPEMIEFYNLCKELN